MGYLTILFMSTTMQLNLPPGLLSSVCFVESSHRISAIHKDDGPEDSLGICQLHYSTAKWMGFKGTPQQLMEPHNNILYAGKYLKYQLNRYKAVNKAVIAYNFGNAKSFTTTKYQVKVFNKWRQ